MKRIGWGSVLILAAGLSVVWAQAAPAATHTVNPGESIQAAVDAAAPGDTVKVMPGDYQTAVPAGSAAVRITKPLKLVAKSKIADGVRVRILPGPGQTDGIVVEPANPGDSDVVGVKIQGFTVEGFPGNGIWLKHVEKFKIMGNESIDNLENGIWPTLSANGSVKKNVSYGSQDSALWVEASENVRVIKNDLSYSPTGLEITVSKKVLVKKNAVHNNSVGIGLYHPNGASLDPLGGDGDWKILGNHVYDNNEPNSAPPGSMSAALPPGIGILVLGVDRVTVKKNVVENNDFVGIGVIDWCAAVDGSAFACDTNPPVVEPAPDDTLVIANVLGDNGLNPPADPILALLAGDTALFAPPLPPVSPVGGTNNCFVDNVPRPPQMMLVEKWLSPNQCS